MTQRDSGYRELPLQPREIVRRGAIVGGLVLGYYIVFSPLYNLIGGPAFLLGLVPCLAAGALLGVRGAVTTIAIVVLLDRSSALRLGGPDTGILVGVVAGLVKLLLAGGLGLVVDSRRRLRRANTQLQRETEAHRKTAASLSSSEQLHRALVESLGEGVGLFGADDKLVFANQALANTLQTSRQQLVGRRFSEFLTNESGRCLRRSRQAGDTRCYDVVLANEHSTPLLVTETKLEAAANQAAMTLRVVRDLSERVVSEQRQRDLERQLQRTQALQSLAVLAGGVAHDFNNLLCGVVGNAELAERKLSSNAPPQLAQCLAEIRSFAGEAAQLSRQMLTYAGRRSLSIEAIDTNSELREALRLLHSTIESKARLLLDLAAELPEAAADRFQLRQVVTNLVLNALDAMDDGRGTLTLRSQAAELDEALANAVGLTPGSYIKITVSDTGRGIADDNRERIFEPYFSTKSPGRGMGLAAALGIVRAHRGWLGIDAVSDTGTTFGILLPQARETTPRAMPESPRRPQPLRPRSILLIDDEPAVRLVTGRLLRELGQEVITADSGASALELFRNQQTAFDLILLDLTMPEQSGREVFDQLCHMKPDVRIVITSGYHSRDAASLLNTPNVVGFIDKPHSLTNLESLLASVNDADAPRVSPAPRMAAADQRWN